VGGVAAAGHHLRHSGHASELCRTRSVMRLPRDMQSAAALLRYPPAALPPCAGTALLRTTAISLIALRASHALGRRHLVHVGRSTWHHACSTSHRSCPNMQQQPITHTGLAPSPAPPYQQQPN
jgi:hypothetical protein